jgi:hypothetical protein
MIDHFRLLLLEWWIEIRVEPNEGRNRIKEEEKKKSIKVKKLVIWLRRMQMTRDRQSRPSPVICNPTHTSTRRKEDRLS